MGRFEAALAALEELRPTRYADGTVNWSTRLPHETTEVLDALASSQGMRRADILREAVREYLLKHMADKAVEE